MAKSQAARAVKGSAITTHATPEEKMKAALKQASTHARKQLDLQRMKLPTQSWTGSRVRNPAV